MVEPLNTVARLWWDWSVAMLWQAGLLIVLIGCVDLLIRKWAWPQLRYALWSLILIKLLLPPTLSLPSGIVPELQPVVSQAFRLMNSGEPAGATSDLGCRIADSSLGAGLQLGAIEIPDVGFQPSVVADNIKVADSPLAANPQSAIANPALAWQVHAMMLWLTGTLILGIWLFLRLHSLCGRHAYQAAAASLPQSFYNQMTDCANRLGLRHVPRVVVTKRLASPAVFGAFRPVLLVPKGCLSKLSRRDTEHMLLHELAHVKRGDLIMHGLYMLLKIAYWYNPLLWLVRRQMHHLRELSCDATVANLLRERTTAYRQTLLETARRLLAASVEPGLGLLGLFEDSNRLLVRLNWLTKPTWRYRTMKRAIVVTLAALMIACVLPMAQARESAPNQVKNVTQDEVIPVSVDERSQQSQDPLSQDIAKLQARLEQLMAQQQELQNQFRALADQRNQMRTSREQTREPGPRSGVRPRRERSPDDLEFAPPEPSSGPGGEQRMPREVQEEVRRVQEGLRRAQEQTWRARRDAETAREATRAQAETEHARAQEQQQWPGQRQAWAGQLRQWEQSEQMQQWHREMENWQKKMQEWAHSLVHEPTDVEGDAPDVAEPAPVPPMPPMPPMPEMPKMPAPTKREMNIQPKSPDPMYGDMTQTRAGFHIYDENLPAVHVPSIEIPAIELPEPPIPPEVPEDAGDLEEAVHHSGFEIGPLQGDQFLEVLNRVGSITVRSGDKLGYTVRATIRGRAETGERAREIAERLVITDTGLQADGGERIIVGMPEGLKDRENCIVTIEVTAPRKARIKLRQEVGDIRLTGLRGLVEAFDRVGSIRATDVSGQVALNTDVGGIDLTVPQDLSAKVQAKADLGGIQSDLPLESAKAGGLSMGSKASGIIGGGEGNVSLKTNMGSIRIRSQSSEPGRAEQSRREPRPGPRPEREF